MENMTLQYRIVNSDICLEERGAPVFVMREVIPDPAKREVLILLAGTLRSDVTGCVEDELNAFVTVDMDILVDMKEVTYVSIAAQQCFLRVQRYADRIGRGRMRLRVPDDALYAGFAETGITELLMIER
ncbi:MAG: hypothetical protein K6A33_09635 [Clostridiales bacterium]|nr:hypothetical protein [Clostridiales bacterium]